MKILIAEDCPVSQLLIGAILSNRSIDYDVAENGRVAVEKVVASRYDIALLDLQMPELSGFEVAAHIRFTMKSMMPIVALTADVNEMDLLRCTESGINECMAKPVDEALLLTTISRLVCPNVVNLDVLRNRTADKPGLMKDLMNLYIGQIPTLADIMVKSMEEGNWYALYSSIHRLLPSFAMVGIRYEYTEAAQEIQRLAAAGKSDGELRKLVGTIAEICRQACEELKLNLNGMEETGG